MSRALIRGPWCQACRHDVLQSFVSIAGVSIAPAATQRFRTTSSIHTIAAQRRSLHNSVSRRADDYIKANVIERTAVSDTTITAATNEAAKTEDVVENPETELVNEDTNEEPTTEIAPSNDGIPWYLQVDTPEPPTTLRPFAHRQELPPLPENPPPILDELLKHISIDIGLDDLALIDLRKVNPPPALGANLLMIIGTARSVKHLNVSADRLCRWLRATHKLSPVADGLLGRNELKIKLRRRNRKAKLASSVGSTLDENRDDGITTGWVCVDVGYVDGGEMLSPDEIIPVEGFVGFGETNFGTKMVVQMMTEEKRADMDLEGLWGKAVERQRQKDEREAAKDAETVEKDSLISGSSSRSGRGFHKPNGMNLTQRRGFHHLHRSWLGPATTHRSVHSVSREPAQDISDNKQSEDLIDKLKVDEDVQVMAQLIHALYSLSPEEVVAELGSGPEDKESTPFLQAFHSKVPFMPSAWATAFRVSLYCLGINNEHPAYNKAMLISLWEEIAVSEAGMTDETVWMIFYTLLSRGKGPEADLRPVSGQPLSVALDVLEIAGLRGMEVLTEEVVLKLHEAIGFGVPVYALPHKATLGSGLSPDDGHGRVQVPHARWAHVRLAYDSISQIMHLAGAFVSSDDTLKKLLTLKFNLNDPPAFWQLWNDISRINGPRSRGLYLHLFGLFAISGGSKNCREALTQLNPMQAELRAQEWREPEMAGLILQTMRIADPDIERIAQQKGKSKMHKLWRELADIVLDAEAV